ncbi:MAB_1171c family putative transporter [Streptomyces sp. V4-01]|uniref:MAB_1171c family putative transporter n=1 Tax=Actinacidiphila polyblastidii TaxID=3110430 RepID=A0ABU7PCY9_9ACTN|nr:MAB_1171c family putative transporter [Streptomyces sp. V4-01]
MNAVFLGMACLLTVAAGYWVLGRGTPRPAGTWAMGALLGSFALAFASYSPLLDDAVETVVPHVARLLSNTASLAAATAVLAVSFQLDLEPAEAKRRVRLRFALFAASAVGMTVLFTYEQMTHRSPQVYALYLLLFISYLGFAIIEFAQQSVRQSRSARRGSVRLGLRLAAAGCAFALVYTAYELTVLVSLGLGIHLIRDHTECSSLVATPCVFSVTSPALAVLLICIGLTLHAVAYPISQARRHRWERRSCDALGPLWQDLSAAMPEIVLPATPHHDASADADFLLQRRVIEISDGILALRPYRSQQVLESMQRTTNVESEEKAAIVEAAVVKAALAARNVGLLAKEVAPPSWEAASRKDLREDTQWLLRVADAYGCQTARLADDDQTPVGG